MISIGAVLSPSWGALPGPVGEGGSPSQGVPLLPFNKCGNVMGRKSPALWVCHRPTGRHRYSFDPDGAEGGHCPMQALAWLVMKGSEQFQQKPHLICGVKTNHQSYHFRSGDQKLPMESAECYAKT